LFPRLLRYLSPYRAKLALALVALLFTSGAVLGLGSALKYLVDSGLSTHNAHLLNQSLALFLGVIIVLAVASYTRVYAMLWISEMLVADIRRDAFDHLLSLDNQFFEKHISGDLVARIMNDASILQQIIVSSISTMARNVLLFIGGIVLLFATSWVLTLMVLALLLLVLPPIIILGKKVRRYARLTQDAMGHLQATTDEQLSGIRTIQAMAAERATRTQFHAQIATNVGLALKRVRSKALLIGMVIFLVFGAVIAVLWFGGHMVIDDKLSAGSLTAFIFYSVMVAGAVGALSEISTDMQRAGGALSRIFELLDAKPTIHAPINPKPLPALEQANIVFDAVHFSYPSRPNATTLKAFDLTVNAGETVALVGASGAGKSTLFQLLMRFYDVSEGSISIGGLDIRECEPTELRRAIGLVPQDPMLFSTTIKANICLNLEASDVEILDALTAANAMEFIDRLPDGINTYVGERGVQLSGGQKQRLAIARTLLRNPAILLLDEATSALDSENEQLVNAALERLTHGRTTIVIAHRLSTVQRAHRIVMMHEGSIEAIGNHETLLNTNERYQRMVSLQFGKR
jgi:ATP-binding cassette subfamily B protein